MPHDLVLFSMSTSSKFAYRAISSFCIAATMSEEDRQEPSLKPVHEALERSESPIKDAVEQLPHTKQRVQPGNRRKLSRKEAEDLQQTIYSPLHPFHVSSNNRLHVFQILPCLIPSARYTKITWYEKGLG